MSTLAVVSYFGVCSVAVIVLPCHTLHHQSRSKGCFWHVQHEFVEAERTILSRTDDTLTSRAGYAGGKAGALDGKVCYHNAANIADYGKLGHAEVVGMKIPSSKFKEFAIEYCKLFDKDGLRPDQYGDRGSEYRNLVGFPGGKNSEFAKLLVDASVASGDKLDFAVGKGDDKDVPKVSFIMDSKEFPFYVAEQYHQVRFFPAELVMKYSCCAVS